MSGHQFQQAVKALEAKVKDKPQLKLVLMKLQAQAAELDDYADVYNLDSISRAAKSWWLRLWYSPERRAKKLSKEFASAERFPYPFENGRGKRIHPHEIRSAREIFLARLGVNDVTRASIAGDEGSEDLVEVLDSFAREVVLSIEYYEAKLKKLQRYRLAAVVGTGLVGLGVLWAIVYFALPPPSKALDPTQPLEVAKAADAAKAMLQPAASVVAAQLGLLVTGVLGALKILAAATDVKAQFATFWKASSDLKGVLYTMEGQWRGQIANCAADAKPQVQAEFKKALLDGIEKAREISEEERGAFFATLKGASDMLSAATDVLEGARGRRSELTTALGDLGRAQDAQPRAGADAEAARGDLRKAQALLAAKVGMIASLDRAIADIGTELAGLNTSDPNAAARKDQLEARRRTLLDKRNTAETDRIDSEADITRLQVLLKATGV